jgi:CubicO group peptidase (beta-lactamase class C family)
MRCLSFSKLAVLSALVLVSTFAASGESTAAQSGAQVRRAAQAQVEFASFIDGFFAGIPKSMLAPGLSFVAVRDGEVVYIKGYGVSDTKSESPVQPDRTMFRVGAISSLVTATALMQLAERGRLGLDEDVNSYLRRWRLPGNFAEPVTLRHLLTHTAGFDCKALEIRAPTSADERGYGARLQKKMPERFAPPGRHYSYSNMGYTLLGSIIERYSRQSFPSAVAKHVLKPLGMESSTFEPTAEQMRNLAAGYDSDGSPLPYEYRYDMPAVGMSATAADMGRFMIAQLNGGVIGRTRILSTMFSNSMLRRHFSPHPLIDGTGLAYYERVIRGVRTLQQSCGIPGYSGWIMLIPDANFGVFYSANMTGLDLGEELGEAIIDRFFDPGGGALSQDATEGGAKMPDGISGYYRTNRIARHSAEKAMHILGDQLRVELSEGGAIVTHTRGASMPAQIWKPLSGDLLVLSDEESGDAPEYMFLQRDDDGKISALIVRDVNQTYDKLDAFESHPWQIAMMFCFAVTLVLSGLGLMLGTTINNNAPPWENDIRAATELWAISCIFCLIQVSFALGLVISAHYLWNEFMIFVPYGVKALFVMPLAAGILLAWFWFRILGNIFNPDHHWAEKALLFIIAANETLYMFFLANWRLLGFMF